MIRTTLLLLLLSAGQAAFSQDSAWLARTIGKYPHIDYGIGEDRLGGAKIGFLDSNILVRVVDSFRNNYKVQLSKYHSAYIPKNDVTLVYKQSNKLLPHNPHVTGTMKVFGDSAFDYVDIRLDERLPYRGMQMIDPSRVAIDVFGVNSNTNWITQVGTTREIKNTWYEQIEDDVFRIYIELKHPQHWGYYLSYDSGGTKLNIRIRRQPAVLDIKKMRIAIDAGHGGTNIGANGGTDTSVLEKNYTLLIAKELEKTLKRAGVKHVFMTRMKDTTLTMPERLDMLHAFSPNFLVSIHLNSTSSDTVRGVSTYYRYIGFRPLSVAILNQMVKLGLEEHGNVGNFNFSLSGPTDFPNALVEVAFLSNPADEKRIRNPRFHKQVAQKIYLGIMDWLKACKP